MIPLRSGLRVEQARRRRRPLALLAAAVLCLPCAANAAPGALSDCSGTVSASSAAISFPKSGGTGPSAPTEYLLISNPDAAAKLGVNAAGAAAAIGSAGTVTLLGTAATNPLPVLIWAGDPPMAVQVISDGSGKPYTCWYR